MKAIYTIGHSNYELDYFLGLLRKFAIDTVIDIRSIPYSSYVPHFNKEYLSKRLKREGIYFIYMGNEFGIIQKSSLLLDTEGFIDFSKVQKTNFFNCAIKRLLTGIEKGHRIALMCSEKDPLECHRGIMITPVLYVKGFNIIHILEDGSFINQKELDRKIVDYYFPKSPQQDFFHIIEKNKSSDDLLKDAYKLRNKYLVKDLPL